MKFITLITSTLIGLGSAVLAPSSITAGSSIIDVSSKPASYGMGWYGSYGAKGMYVKNGKMVVYRSYSSLDWYELNDGTGDWDFVKTTDFSGSGLNAAYSSTIKLGRVILSDDGSTAHVGLNLGASPGSTYSSRTFLVSDTLEGTYSFNTDRQSFDTATHGTYGIEMLCVSPDGNTVVTNSYISGTSKAVVWTTSNGGTTWTKTLVEGHNVDAIMSNTFALKTSFAKSCEFLDNDNIVFGSPNTNYGTSSSYYGLISHHNKDTGGAGTWGVVDTWATNYNGLPVMSSNTYFGEAMKLNPSGDKLVVNGRGHNSMTGGLWFFDWDGTSLTFDELVSPSQDDIETTTMGFRGNFEWVDDTTLAVGAGTGDTEGLYNNGHVIVFQKSINTWDVVQKIKGTFDGQMFADKVITYNNVLYVYSKNEYTNTYPNVGSFHAFTLPECLTSPDCPSGEICTDNQECIAVACTENVDCASSMQTGRLGRCVSGACTDYTTGTCNTTNECDNLVNKAFTAANSVGEKKVTYGASDINATENACKNLIDQVRADVVDDSNLYASVSGSSTAIFSRAFFDESSDDSTALASIKAVVCGDVPCTINSTDGAGGSRRILQAAGEVAVVITFDIDEGLFAELLARNEFTDPAFVTALAAQSGIPAGNITINTASSTLEVTFVVAEESDGVDPIDNTIVGALNNVSSSADSIAVAVATDLGLNTNEVEISSIDLCGDRDCNGRGTCDSDTGICACTDLNYWGINCETPVSCTSGRGTPRGQYCHCDYPYIGLRCESISTVCSDGNCV